MADTVTPVLGLVKPEVNGAQTENVWGFDLNANFDKIDVFAGEVSVMIDAPSDSVIYGRLNAAWTPTVLKTDFDALTTTVAGKAPLASPVFTGNPTAPTPAAADNDTSIATTAFVKSVAIAAGAVFPSDANPLAPGTAAPGVSTNYSRADHVHPAPTNATDPTKVAKAGDTMTGALAISTGGMTLYGWGGNAAAGVLFMNSTQDAYLHQTGALFAFVGKPVSINDVSTSSLPSNGAFRVAGGAGIGGALNVGGAFTGSSSGSFGNSIQLPDTTGIGWGNFPHTTGTPQFVYNSGMFQFSKVPGAAVLAMNPVSLASTFGGALTVNTALTVGTTGQFGGGVRLADGQGIGWGAFPNTPGTPQLVYGSQTIQFNIANPTPTTLLSIHTTSLQSTFGGDVIVPSLTASTSTSTGAVVVSGGLGVTGSANLGPTTVWGGLGCTLDFYTSAESFFNGATPAWFAAWDIAVGVKFRGGVIGSGGQFGMGFRPISDSTTAIGFLRADGTVAVGNIYMTDTAVAYGTASDARLKSDLKPLESGDLIDRIKTYDFCWQNGKRGRGVLAQEAAKVVPEACYEQADTWFTDYSKFVPLLLAEMKALRARVAELEGRA
jgi:hypothetical protein